MSEPLRTPLYDVHVALSARFTSFGGWEMPVQYSGIVNEHRCVREGCGIFDVSHMGEVLVTGPGALSYLQRVTSNDVSKLLPGKAQYSLLLRENGGVVDDIIVYQLDEFSYFICVNAANRHKDVKWLQDRVGDLNSDDVSVSDVSDEYAQVAVQGPLAWRLMSDTFHEDEDFSLSAWPAFTHKIFLFPRPPAGGFRSGGASKEGGDSRAVERSGNIELIVARTGYTGEDGFEIFCEPEAVGKLWQVLMDNGRKYGIEPIGLGARDTLRLEASYPLYGHELNDDRSPYASGVGWVVKLGKGDFLGRESLLSQKVEGVGQRLVGFEVSGRGIVRDACPLVDADGREVGISTSGSYTPTLDKSVGMAVVDVAHAHPGTVLQAQVRGKNISIVTLALPLYKRRETSRAS